MAWHQTGDKSLPQPMVIQVIDVHHQGPFINMNK